MIIAFFLEVLIAFLSVLLAILPTVPSLPSGLTDAIAFVGSHIGAVSSWFPVTTLLTVFGLVLGFESGMLIFWSINWIINKFRGSG